MSDLSLRFGFGVRTPDFNFGFSIGRTEATHCRSRIDDFFSNQAMQRWQQPAELPHCASVPSPSIGMSGPPAGQGLRQNPDGSVTTAGGYTIKAEGKDAAWNITGPDGKELTRVWGDPHVSESDGTKWDFTKSSDFVLPDGTRIAAKTNYDPAQKNGQSVTTGLDITNGADRASITGIEGGSPQTKMSNDGFEWRATHVASDPNRDSFHLGGSGADNVNWTRERNGQIDGIVQHSANHDYKVSAGDHQIYDQQVDAGAVGRATGALAPPEPWTRAGGNMLRNQLNDAQAKAWGQMMGPIGAWPAWMNSLALHQNHNRARFETDLNDMLFGGWRGCFSNSQQPFNAMSGMIDMMRADRDWRRQVQFSIDATIA